LHGNRREYTWYSPNRGNGFRLDEAFIHRSLIPSVSSVEYYGAPGAPGRRDVGTRSVTTPRSLLISPDYPSNRSSSKAAMIRP
jgi:hypothetical protein